MGGLRRVQVVGAPANSPVPAKPRLGPLRFSQNITPSSGSSGWQVAKPRLGLIIRHAADQSVRVNQVPRDQVPATPPEKKESFWSTPQGQALFVGLLIPTAALTIGLVINYGFNQATKERAARKAAKKKKAAAAKAKAAST